MENMVKLQMRKVPYTNSEGKEKIATNFFVMCGNIQVPIEVKYFKNDEGVDLNYNGRKTVMESYAEVLPPKESSGNSPSTKSNESK